MTIAKLMAAEIFIIIMSSAVLCALTIAVVDHFSNDLVRMAFIR